MLVGATLTVGILTRISAIVVIGIMVVATYVHFVVNDPSLSPLQPELPIMPIMVIIFSAYLIKEGGGSWSKDLKN